MKNDGSNIVQFQPFFPSTCTCVSPFRLEAVHGLSGISHPPHRHTFRRSLGHQRRWNDGLRSRGRGRRTSSHGFPDLIAHALHFADILDNDIAITDRTSCSAPVRLPSYVSASLFLEHSAD